MYLLNRKIKRRDGKADYFMLDSWYTCAELIRFQAAGRPKYCRRLNAYGTVKIFFSKLGRRGK